MLEVARRGARTAGRAAVDRVFGRIEANKDRIIVIVLLQGYVSQTNDELEHSSRRP